MADLDETNDAPLVLRRLTGTQRIMQEVALIITKPQVTVKLGQLLEQYTKALGRIKIEKCVCLLLIFLRKFSSPYSLMEHLGFHRI